MEDLDKASTLTSVKIQTVPKVAETIDAASLIPTTADGPTINITADDLERDLMTGDPFQYDFEKSMVNGDWSLAFEFKAGSTPGAVPEYAPLLQSFGFAIESLDGTISTVAGSTSTTVLEVPEAAIGRYKKNRIIGLKKNGAGSDAGVFHVSPIASVDTVNFTITLRIPLPTAPSISDSFPIVAITNFAMSKSVNVILTISKIMDGQVRFHQVTDARTGSIAKQNWAAGQIPSLLCSGTALEGTKNIGSAMNLTPEFDTSKPPVIVEACLWVNGIKRIYTENTWTMERPVVEKKSGCAKNNKVKNRHSGTEKDSGSFVVYQDDEAIAFEVKGPEFDIFEWAGRPSSADEFKFIVASYIPRAKANSVEDGDIDGLASETVSWTAVAADASEKTIVATI